ncbi:hypothetical protein XENOCAPTIV_027954, partial [Xenoophorus captivus]
SINILSSVPSMLPRTYEDLCSIAVKQPVIYIPFPSGLAGSSRPGERNLTPCRLTDSPYKVFPLGLRPPGKVEGSVYGDGDRRSGSAYRSSRRLRQFGTG